MFEWSDLKYFLAVATHGSTLAAARALGVNQSTVQRRITELERRLGHNLTHRHPTGYQLTEFGEALLPAARQVEAAVAALERQTEAFGLDLVGTIRLTCPEPLAGRLARSAFLEAFHARYPALRVELVMSDRYLDLNSGGADVALRSGDAQDETLVGRRIADSIWALYASKSYIQQNGRPQGTGDLDRHAIVAFDGTLATNRAAAWLASVAPNARVAASNTSILGVMLAVKSGVGVAPLPTTIAGADDELEAVSPAIPELTRGWYLLTRPDLRQTSRVAAFFDFTIEHLDLIRPVLMG